MQADSIRFSVYVLDADERRALQKAKEESQRIELARMGDFVRPNGDQAPEELTSREDVPWRDIGDEKIARNPADDGADVEERCREGEFVAVHVEVFFHAADVGVAEVGLCGRVSEGSKRLRVWRVLTVQPFGKVPKTAICQNEEVDLRQQLLLFCWCSLWIPPEEFGFLCAVGRFEGILDESHCSLDRRRGCVEENGELEIDVPGIPLFNICKIGNVIAEGRDMHDTGSYQSNRRISIGQVGRTSFML